MLAIIWLIFFFFISKHSSLRDVEDLESTSHTYFKPNREGEQRQCSLTKESSTGAHTCHVPAPLRWTKQAQSDITLSRLIRGTGNTACGQQCNLVSSRLQTKHSKGELPQHLPASAPGELGEAGGQGCRVSEPHGTAGAVLCPRPVRDRDLHCQDSFRGHCFSFWPYTTQCCNKVWCSYLKTKPRNWVVLNEEAIINSRTSQ